MYKVVSLITDNPDDFAAKLNEAKKNGYAITNNLVVIPTLGAPNTFGQSKSALLFIQIMIKTDNN
jgi:hypothetical protein